MRVHQQVESVATLKIIVKDICGLAAVAVSPSTPVQNGDTQTMRTTQSKIESIKNWSISTYKCTKQLMYERLGKTSRTVDFGEFSAENIWLTVIALDSLYEV